MLDSPLAPTLRSASFLDMATQTAAFHDIEFAAGIVTHDRIAETF
jgi:hypothetical protein